MKGSRREFPRRVKLAAWDRSGGRCETCGRKLRPGDGIEYDHRVPAEQGGTNKPENCQVLCRWCHAAKTGEDMKTIAKGRRVRAGHANAKTPKRRLPGARGSGWKARLDGTWERRNK